MGEFIINVPFKTEEDLRTIAAILPEKDIGDNRYCLDRAMNTRDVVWFRDRPEASFDVVLNDRTHTRVKVTVTGSWPEAIVKAMAAVKDPPRRGFFTKADPAAQWQKFDATLTGADNDLTNLVFRMRSQAVALHRQLVADYNLAKAKI